ncbi:MAG: FtsW/RodA/SpoVE family cell cycle protein, partial [Defluviitaleaceae bacterium]|nr:FtsW/RodA/SpoVE family cell cycle protein [Defluviitaleaceae bacterium]
MILFLAKFLDVKNDRLNNIFWLGLTLILIAVPVYFVMEQPSLSASLVVLSLSVTVLFVAGLYYRTILIGGILVSPIAIMVWLDLLREQPIFLTALLGEFQWTRIETWRNPILGSDPFRQTQQSLYAITSGGLTGQGFLNNSHVIHGHNDFVFSLVANQFGFAGAVILLAVVAFVIVRCILIALRAQDMTGRLIAAGVAGMLIFETFVHVSVTTNFLPNTGMPFPFLSFGGSMIWVHMMAIGVVLNVGLPRKKAMFNDDR